MSLDVYGEDIDLLAAAPADYVVVPYSGLYCAVKRLFDVCVACVMLVLLGPIMLIAALLVKVTSKGPVLYQQVRLGSGGRPFRVWKFRTMVADAESQTGPVWASADDPRITRLGRILRDTHVDEFPQLFNVILGSMSLVGPRPERPEIIEQLERRIPNYSQRMLVRPGITGFAQVRLPADTDLAGVRRKLAYDLYYVAHLNPWMDLKILAITGLDFFRSVLGVLASCLVLPPAEKVEQLVPHLLTEAAARESFLLEAQAIPSRHGHLEHRSSSDTAAVPR
jgi:lipopolysaccharide/colanic/teichoic acid biosynthesis glycosyltransferase